MNIKLNGIILVTDEACRPSRAKSRTATIPYRLILSLNADSL